MHLVGVHHHLVGLLLFFFFFSSFICWLFIPGIFKKKKDTQYLPECVLSVLDIPPLEVEEPSLFTQRRFEFPLAGLLSSSL